MIPTYSQFPKQRAAEIEQTAVDLEWAKKEWKKKGGDRKAKTFVPDYEGQSYEEQLRGKNNG
jgi:hypothetical protein